MERVLLRGSEEIYLCVERDRYRLTTDDKANWIMKDDLAQRLMALFMEKMVIL